jgi:hypothetical protein
MKFWDTMQSIHGFDSGHLIPADAEVRRDTYLRVLNRLLQNGNSNARYIPRILAEATRASGVNTCTVSRVTVESYEHHMRTTGSGVRAFNIELLSLADTDDAHDDARAAAHDLLLDDFITVTTEVATEQLDEALRRLENGSSDEAGTVVGSVGPEQVDLPF